MKEKTLGWIQVAIGLILWIQAIGIISRMNETFMYELGTVSDILLIGLLAVATGKYHLCKKK